MDKDQIQISRVTRSKETARTSYNRMSRWYDLIAGSSEWKYVKIGLKLLHVVEEETVLEIGFGTGKAIVALAHAVGENGRVFGIDLSEGMRTIAERRVANEGLSARVELRSGDAVSLSYDDSSFDAVFSSFTLDLFDTPEIPVVLNECHRVLKDEGRIVIVSMSKKTEEGLAIRLYEWAHEKIPSYVDCRPILVSESISRAGFELVEFQERKMWGLPVDVVLGKKT